MNICDHDLLRALVKLIPCDRIGAVFVGVNQITLQQLKLHKALRHRPVVLSLRLSL
jgi:hypothetical protein